MNKNFKEISASNVVWVEYWIDQVQNSDEEVLTAFGEKYDCYRWICEIELPLINKKVQAISEKEVNAVLRANAKAAKLINEYMKEHPELKIKNNHKRKGYVLAYDDDGRVLYSGQSKKSRRKKIIKYDEAMTKAMALVQNTIKKINKMTGSSGNLFLQVMDQKQYDGLSAKAMMNITIDKIKNNYNVPALIVRLDDDTNSIISIGTSLPKSSLEDDDAGEA